MYIYELIKPDDVFESLYRDVFLPSFTADELTPPQPLRESLERRDCRVWVAEDDAGEVVGGALGEWDAEPRVMLLSWMAVRPDRRGLGVGAPLLRAALDAWREEFDPCLILTEVSDPAFHAGAPDADHGDPVARLRFYQRQGARALDLPYFQAALGPDRQRVEGMHLMVLHAAPRFAGERPDTIDGGVLRAYIELFQLQCEGRVATDERALELFRAIDRPGGVAYSS